MASLLSTITHDSAKYRKKDLALLPWLDASYTLHCTSSFLKIVTCNVLHTFTLLNYVGIVG